MDEEFEQAFETLLTAMQRDRDLSAKMIGIQRAVVGALKGLIAANSEFREQARRGIETEYVFLLNKAHRDETVNSFEITKNQLLGSGQ